MIAECFIWSIHTSARLLHGPAFLRLADFWPYMFVMCQRRFRGKETPNLLGRITLSALSDSSRLFHSRGIPEERVSAAGARMIAPSSRR